MISKDALINIHFVSDDKYVLPLGVAIKSILDHAGLTEKFSFNIVDVGISEKNKDRLCALGKSDRSLMRFLNINEHISYNLADLYQESTASKKQYISSAAIAKFFIPLLDPDLGKTIYLDCDVIVLDSLVGAWDIDLQDNFAAVVPDLKLTHSDKNSCIEFSKEDMYFNSGFMVLNLRKMRDIGCIREYMRIASDKGMRCRLRRFLDQDQFNLIFKGQVKVLPLSYNLFSRIPVVGEHGVSIEILKWMNCRGGCISSYYEFKDVRTAIRSPVVVHFVTRFKPWTSCGGFMFNRWVRIASKIEWANKSKWEPVFSLRRLWVLRPFILLKDILFLCYGNIPARIKAMLRGNSSLL